MIGYEDDLAHIHDTGFGDFAVESAPALLRILRRHGVGSGLVVDLGCGSGIWARELLKSGYRVLGIDISPAMIRLAGHKAPGARFVTASLFDAAIPACDAVTATAEALNYAFDRRNNPRLVRMLLRRVFDALRPGGVFLLDFAEPGQTPDALPRQSFWESEDWAVLVESREDHRRRLLTREITTFRRRGGAFRRHDETHVLRLYEAGTLASELERAGFVTKIQTSWGDWKLPPAHAAIVARKASGPVARVTARRRPAKLPKQSR